MKIPNNIRNDFWQMIPERRAPHVVLDLESMSTATDCAIIAIGAVCCDSSYDVTGGFFTPINLESCIDAGLRIDASTLTWWMGQDEAAKSGLNLLHGTHIATALAAFHNWWRESCEEQAMLWGNGSDFDNAALSMAYRIVGNRQFDFIAGNIIQPWNFWNNQSLRTLKMLDHELCLHLDKPQPYIPHHALYDAYAEAEHIKHIMTSLHAMDTLANDPGM